MKKKLFWCIFLYLFLHTKDISAQLVLFKDGLQMPLSAFILNQHWEVAKGDHPFLSHSKDSSFTHKFIRYADTKSFFMKQGVYWARIRLKNASEKSEICLIEFSREFSQIEAFYGLDEYPKLQSVSGSGLSPASKNVILPQGHNGILVSLKAFQDTWLYVKLDNRGILGHFRQLDMHLESTLKPWAAYEQTLNKQLNTERLYGFLFLAFVLYHFLLGLSVQKDSPHRKVYLYYAGSIFGILVTTLSQRLMLYYYFPAYWVYHVISHLALGGTLYFLIQFTVLYLNPGSPWIRYLHLFKLCLWSIPTYVFIEEFLTEAFLKPFQELLSYVYLGFINIFIWSFALLIILMSIQLKRQGNSKANYYFWSFALYFMFIVVLLCLSVMITLNWITFPETLQEIYIPYINLIMNACVLMIFSLGVGANINQLNQALVYHNKELEARVQEQIEEKENLIHLLTHNLKNQLDVVSTCSESITKSIPKNKNLIQNNLQVQQNALSNIQEMIQRIWSVNARNHQFHLNLQKHNVIQIVEDVVLQVDSLLEKKAIHIDTLINLSNTKAKYISVDLVQTELIINELITNAIKYTSFGSEIIIEICDQSDYTLVKILDEGPGIAPEEQYEIFKRYKIGRAKPTQGESSTGVGLYFVKKYIEAMDGIINFANHADKGVEFTLFFKKFQPHKK